MNSLHKLRKIAQMNGGIIENKTAASAGISRAVLSKLYQENKLERLIRGQYILCGDVQDELLSLELRSKYLVFSHETALYLHEINDRIPFIPTMTAPSNKIPSKSIRQDCKVYYIKPELFELGKTKLKTKFGNEVSVYNLERTVCDIIRSRNQVGTETFLTALKMYSNRLDKNLNQLYTVAKEMGIAGIVKDYMEVIL